MRMPSNKALQRTAAPPGVRTVREDLLAILAEGLAFPAAVRELSGWASA